MKTAINLRRVRSLLLASMLAASLVLALPVQARTPVRYQHNPGGRSQPRYDGTPPHLYRHDDQQLRSPARGLKDFFPEGAELVSAAPSQGNCGAGHRSNAVQCTLGDLSSGGSATVEVVVLPTVPGTAKNTAVGGGEHSPEVSDEATVEVKPTP